MPCQCDGYDNIVDRQRIRDLDQATRAACDMRTILRRFNLEHALCPETLVWIKRHDAADAERIAQEEARGERKRVKREALNKLSMDERRALGL